MTGPILLVVIVVGLLLWARLCKYLNRNRRTMREFVLRIVPHIEQFTKAMKELGVTMKEAEVSMRRMGAVLRRTGTPAYPPPAAPTGLRDAQLGSNPETKS